VTPKWRLIARLLGYPQEKAGDLFAQILANPPGHSDSNRKARRLGDLENHTEALQSALRLAWDPAPGYRCLGVVALARLQARGLMDAQRRLRELAADPVGQVRRTLAQEVHLNENPEAGEILLALVSDPDPWVRAEVPDGLHVQGTPVARAAFLRLLRDPDNGVRTAASTCLRYFVKDPIRPDEALDLAIDQVPEVRAQVALWLGREAPAAALGPLFKLAEDPSATVREHALDALGRFLILDARVFPRLLQGFEDPAPAVRAKAVRLLHRHPAPEALEALLKRADDPDNDVRQHVARGLDGRATIEMLPILERLAEDDGSSLIRWATAQALAALPGSGAETLLVRLTRDPAKKVVTAARQILERRAKAGLVEPPTEFELRYGQKEAVATRLAFRGESTKPLHAWEKFIASIQRLDGALAGGTTAMPGVLFTREGEAAWAILPFGPMLWICLEWVAGEAEGQTPRMGYALRRTEDLVRWVQAIEGAQAVKGRKLAKKLGWIP